MIGAANRLNYTTVTDCFGSSIDWNKISMVTYNTNLEKQWVWSPAGSTACISREVYGYLNNNAHTVTAKWNGWQKLWSLPIAPRVKIFIWRLLYGRIPTYEYMYSLGFGPQMECSFCGLASETLKHMMIECRMAIFCWNAISEHTGWDGHGTENFLQGEWICNVNGVPHIDKCFVKCLMATCAWAIWKARCDNIFNNRTLQPHQLFKQALTITQDHYWKAQRTFREYLHISIFNQSNIALCDASWTDSQTPCGIGFIIIKGQDKVIMAGNASCLADTSLQAEVQAIKMTLECCSTGQLNTNIFYSDCLHAIQLIKHDINTNCDRLQNDLDDIKHYLQDHPEAEIKFCPREINFIPDLLAKHGRNNPGLSLYHQGNEKPRWLEEKLTIAGLHF